MLSFQALEGIGGSQEVKSQDIALSRSDSAGGGDAVEFNGKEGESLSRSDDGGNEDVIGFSQLSLEDKGWISPPDSLFWSSSGSGITSTEASFPDSLNDLTENKELLSQGSSSRNPTDHMHSASISHSDADEISPFKLSEFKSAEPNANDDGAVKSRIDEVSEHSEAKALPHKSVTIPADAQNLLNENLEKFEGEAEPISSSKDKNDTGQREASDHNLNASSRVGRGMYQVHNCYFSSHLCVYVLIPL